MLQFVVTLLRTVTDTVLFDFQKAIPFCTEEDAKGRNYETLKRLRGCYGSV